MKLPSIIRVPQYQRFRIEPRYYDPVKEEIRKRTEGIRREVEGEDDTERIEYNSRISGSFTRKSRIKVGKDFTGVRQLAIGVALIAGLAGYLEFGNDILYVGLLIIPLYIYYKLKK